MSGIKAAALAKVTTLAAIMIAGLTSVASAQGIATHPLALTCAVADTDICAADPLRSSVNQSVLTFQNAKSGVSREVFLGSTLATFVTTATQDLMRTAGTKRNHAVRLGSNVLLPPIDAVLLQVGVLRQA